LILSTLNSKGSVTLTNGDRYPFVNTITALGTSVLIKVEDSKPKYRVNPVWTFDLKDDGTLDETYTPFIDQSGATEPSYVKHYNAKSIEGRERINWIKENLNLVPVPFDPQTANRNLREMLKGLLEKLSNAPAQPAQKSLVIFDGEKVPFFSSQTWDAADSSAAPGNGGKILTLRLNNSNAWAAAGIPLNKFLYVDVSSYKNLKFKARSSKRIFARVFLVDSNAGTESTQVKFEVDTAFKAFTIDLNGLRGSDLNLKDAQAIIFAVSEPQDGVFTLDIDDLSFDMN